MKISKLLNNKFYLIIILIFFFSASYLYAEDQPVDIWKLEKSIEEKPKIVKISSKKVNH